MKGLMMEGSYLKRTMAYLSHPDCGLSATAMIYKFNGIEGMRVDHPHDPSDFSRCLKLLDRFPLYRLHLPMMRDCSPEWALLIDAWDKLEFMFNHQDPEMYNFMRSLFDSIPCEVCGKPLNQSYRGEKGKRYHWGQCWDNRDESED